MRRKNVQSYGYIELCIRCAVVQHLKTSFRFFTVYLNDAEKKNEIKCSKFSHGVITGIIISYSTKNYFFPMNAYAGKKKTIALPKKPPL